MHQEDSAERLRRWQDDVVLALASVGYLGYVPVASGTFGSIPGVLMAWWLHSHPAGMLVLAILIFAVGVVASTRAEAILLRHDPSTVTIDEFVGMLVAFLWIPFTWKSAILVFVLYRTFDVFKPFPARRCEQFSGGFGIMTDDVVAGIYANVVFRLIVLILPFSAV